MAGFRDLERGAPGSEEGRDSGFAWAVVGWGFGWVNAALFSVPDRLRSRGLLFLLSAILATLEKKGPRRALQWARNLSDDSSTSVDVAAIRDTFGLDEDGEI